MRECDRCLLVSTLADVNYCIIHVLHERDIFVCFQPESFNRNALTSRAMTASIAIASENGITVDEPKILADAYSVRVHLQPARIVARVSTHRFAMLLVVVAIAILGSWWIISRVQGLEATIFLAHL